MKKDIGFLIKSLSNQLRRLMERNSLKENAANLTGTQYAMLGFIAEKIETGDVFQKDVEAEFNLRRSSASGALKSLESLGYIRRESMPGDARMKRIIQTDKSRELNKIARKHMDELQTRLTRGIDPKELDICYSVLEKIFKNASD
ncbi:MAG: MarR family winged helix-turn-helix transcriptional regulator [Lachnospiraceae bacterium]